MGNTEAEKVVTGGDVPDVTRMVNTISGHGRKAAFEMDVFKYRGALAGEAVEQKFGDLQPLVVGLKRLAGTDLAMVMVTLSVMLKAL